MATRQPRRHARVATGFKVQVRLPHGQTFSAGQVQNISLGGVFIEMFDPPGFGVDLDLEFSLPTHPQAIRCEGFVVWSTKSSPDKAPGKQGIGVRLTDIGVNEMRILSDFIESHSKRR